MQTEPADMAGAGLVDPDDEKTDMGLPGVLPVGAGTEQAGDPYDFICDGVRVHISFGSEEWELSKLLADYFLSL